MTKLSTQHIVTAERGDICQLTVPRGGHGRINSHLYTLKYWPAVLCSDWQRLSGQCCSDRWINNHCAVRRRPSWVVKWRHWTRDSDVTQPHLSSLSLRRRALDIGVARPPAVGLVYHCSTQSEVFCCSFSAYSSSRVQL